MTKLKNTMKLDNFQLIKSVHSVQTNIVSTMLKTKKNIFEHCILNILV